MMSTSPSSQRRVSTVPASSTVSHVLPSQELSTNVVLPSAPVPRRRTSQRRCRCRPGALDAPGSSISVRSPIRMYEVSTRPCNAEAPQVSERQARRAAMPRAHLLHLRELHLLAAVLVELRGRAEVQERLRGKRFVSRAGATATRRAAPRWRARTSLRRKTL